MDKVEYHKKRKTFLFQCSSHPNDGALKKLKREWDSKAYGDYVGRVSLLQAFAKLRSEAASSSSSGRVSDAAVTYQAGGFHSGKECAASSEQLFAGNFDIRIVTRPIRGNSRILRGIANHLFFGETSRVPRTIYVSNEERCPLRPLVLIHGEADDTSKLREEFGLGSDVFVLGLSKEDPQGALLPHASQHLFGGSAMYRPSNLLQRPCTMSWADRPCMLGFMTMRSVGRQRPARIALAEELAKLLKTSDLGPAWTLNAPCKNFVDKSKWAKKYEARLSSDGCRVQLDRAVSLYEHCKFVLAIENSQQSHYITEKEMLPLLAGAVPICWGCEEIRQVWNPEAIIDITHLDISNPKSVKTAAAYIVKEMRAFCKRKKPLPKNVINQDLYGWFATPPLGSVAADVLRWARTL